MFQDRTFYRFRSLCVIFVLYAESPRLRPGACFCELLLLLHQFSAVCIQTRASDIGRLLTCKEHGTPRHVPRCSETMQRYCRHHLFAVFWRPALGHIRLDGAALHRIDANALRRKFQCPLTSQCRETSLWRVQGWSHGTDESLP